MEQFIKKSDENARICTMNLASIFEENTLDGKLIIPTYQRPYSWHCYTNNKSVNQVKQLLDDINTAIAKEENEYRIGTIIFYKHDEKNGEGTIYDIVDGQQRLMTLSLILFYMGYNSPLLDNNRNDLKTESLENIEQNFKYLVRYLSEAYIDKDKWKDFILMKCTFNIMIVNRIDEAFQLFDSQNTRGKKLNPEDLLKAYHLRNMQSQNDGYISENEKIKCIEEWEKSINNGTLHSFIANHLFPIRRLMENREFTEFSISTINEFKGINLEELKKSRYPMSNAAIYHAMCPYYTINEQIINGMRFFKYVNYYLNIYHNTDFYKYCDVKKFRINRNRKTDQRLENLYKNALFAYTCKFGNDSLNSFSKIIFTFIFYNILYRYSISEQTIANELIYQKRRYNIFSEIKHWHYPDLAKVKELCEIKHNNNELRYSYRLFKSENITTEKWIDFCNKIFDKND